MEIWNQIHGNSAVVAFDFLVIGQFVDVLLLSYHGVHEDDLLHDDLCLVRFKSKPAQSTSTVTLSLSSFSADAFISQTLKFEIT